jgi:hypothetical protein
MGMPLVYSSRKFSVMVDAVFRGPFKACGDVEQQFGCGVARLRTRRCWRASEKNALQHFELRPIGLSDAIRIASDAAGDGRNGAVTVRLAYSSSKRMEERIGLTFGKGMLLRLFVRVAAGEHACSKRFSRFDGALIRVGIEGHVRGVNTSGGTE